MDLPFVMGIELTGIHRLYNEDNGQWHSSANGVGDRKQADLMSIQRELARTHTKYHDINFDDHCIEISSPKLSTFETYKAFSLKTRKILANHDYYPKNPTAVCGGAHIHVGMPKTDWGNQFKWHLARDLIMRPYLPWIFGEPDEEGAMNVLINKQKSYQDMEAFWWAAGNDGANSLATSDRAVSRLGRFNSERYIKHLSLPYNPRTKYVTMSHWDGKNNMFLLSSYGTVEFRFFEMAPDWEDQELQLRFLIAYLNWHVLRMDNGLYTDIRLISDKDMQRIEPDVCEDLFEELCYSIGVDFEDYEHIIDRNLYPRWTEGRKRV